MSLFSEWKEIVDEERSKPEYDVFWKDYFEKEKNNYQEILKDRDIQVNGKFGELAEKFGMTLVEFAGFLDGINTSLVEELNLDDLNEESDISLKLDYEKLYYNMLAAKADWLYNLEEWEDILTLDKRKEILKDFNRSRIATSNKVGRNDPCPCGSGKKHKKCCGA